MDKYISIYATALLEKLSKIRLVKKYVLSTFCVKYSSIIDIAIFALGYFILTHPVVICYLYNSRGVVDYVTLTSHRTMTSM